MKRIPAQLGDWDRGREDLGGEGRVPVREQVDDRALVEEVIDLEDVVLLVGAIRRVRQGPPLGALVPDLGVGPREIAGGEQHVEVVRVRLACPEDLREATDDRVGRAR